MTGSILLHNGKQYDEVDDMAFGFPLYIDLHGNNCVVLGGGRFAASRVSALLRFGAKVTVISPTLCQELQDMDDSGTIRYIPRRYYRGDCTSAYLCVAATDTESVNIAISDECKAKGIPVNVSKPSAFGTFFFPSVVIGENITISVGGTVGAEVIDSVCRQIEEALPGMLDAAERAVSEVSPEEASSML